MFILAVLESDLEDGVSENEEATDGVRVAAGGSADATAGSTQRHSTQDDDMETAAGAGAGGAEERPQSTPTSVLESTNPGMQFRMFLLPGAIEQALDHYARENGAGSGETARAEASAVGNSVGAAEQEQGQPDPSSSAPSENDLTEHVEEVFMDEPGDDADAIDRLLLGHAAGTSRPSSSPEHGGAQHAREQTSDEARRAEAQRLREEKFQRLRNIAQAMNDERRTIAIPMVLLGLRINSELRRTTRMALRDAANASDAPQQQQQQQEQEQQRVESAAAAQPIGGLHGALRGLRDRLSGIVPSLFSSSGSAGLHGAQSSGQSDAAEPDSRVHGSRSEAGVAAGEAGAGAGAGDGFAEAATSATAAPNESNQPGLSVFITIRYMQLGNPAILPMVTYSMFPELFSSSPTSSNVHTNLTASNYDLFIEISNIIGQARASTVSQDVIDKRMKKYQYECGRSGGVATARVAGAGAGVDEVVKLVSAERCPVCLEEFAEGDDLRVLTCCHALHLSCGDAWFTQGSNMCPICRQPAIQIGSNKS
ncbi:hypothetical protein LPJ75_001947 [Coemansia sp. RSA 2598]|nr:hypothetical protein LPJ75_001947 [Coemansia sp. RSA 2598]